MSATEPRDPLFRAAIEAGREAIRGAQDARAFAALDAMPNARYQPLQRLTERLFKFGHSDHWALDLASEWYRMNSKLYRPK